eukprot:TRINITY_DN1030_c0_g2_i2.p1 TRINITY_DN1030_c0_g2~~TRINITY_DN1030_c0_g2_i2.p1  ORF type:complete len:153 (-),score=13.27 TRINITY_DN1030_c0_g2_i2:161-619(-)
MSGAYVSIESPAPPSYVDEPGALSPESTSLQEGLLNNNSNHHQQQLAFTSPGGTTGYAEYRAPAPTTTVIVVKPPAQLSRHPQMMRCQHCGYEALSIVKRDPGFCTYLWCVSLCVVGCGFGCCLIPFCTDECRYAVHTCPHCGFVIGVRDAC